MYLMMFFSINKESKKKKKYIHIYIYMIYTDLVYLTNLQIHVCQYHSYVNKDKSHSGSSVININLLQCYIYMCTGICFLKFFFFITNVQIRELAYVCTCKLYVTLLIQ